MSDAYAGRLAQLRSVAASVVSSNGGPAVADSLSAIVTGAIAGALIKIDRRQVYDIVQGLADEVAGAIADDNCAKAKAKGQAK